MNENKTEVKDKTGRTEVSFDELSYSNMMSIEALMRVLEKKGIECEVPPKIFKDSVFVAYLTENENITPRVSTYSLIEFLYDEGKGTK